MTKEAMIFEVTDKSYGKYVLLNSHKVPVVMAFIGVWSEPCFILTETFSTLAKEYPEDFVFAKLDIDESPEAKKEYEIANVPTTIVFKDGVPVRREEGQLSYDEARALLRDFGIYRESDELLSKARLLHMQGDTPSAITTLTGAIQQDPSNTRVALDMVQIFIDIGQLDEAEQLLHRLPKVDQDDEVGVSLSGQLWIYRQAEKTDGIEKLSARIDKDKLDFDAHFDKAICEIALHNVDEAMTHLFFIQQQKADFKEGAAREMIISVINTLAVKSPELAQTYRRQLSNLINE